METAHWLYAILAFVYYNLWQSEVIYSPETGTSEYLQLVNIVYCALAAFIATYHLDAVFLVTLLLPSAAAIWFGTVHPYLETDETSESQTATAAAGNSLVTSENTTRLANKQDGCLQFKLALDIGLHTRDNLHGLELRSDRSLSFPSSSSCSSAFVSTDLSDDSGKCTLLTPSSSISSSFPAQPVLLVQKEDNDWNQDPADQDPSVWIDQDGIAFAATDSDILVRMGLVPSLSATSMGKYCPDDEEVELHRGAVVQDCWNDDPFVSSQSQIECDKDITSSKLCWALQSPLKQFDDDMLHCDSDWDEDQSLDFESAHGAAIPILAITGETSLREPADAEPEFDLMVVSHSFQVLSAPPSNMTAADGFPTSLSGFGTGMVAASSANVLPPSFSFQHEVSAQLDDLDVDEFEVEQPRRADVDSSYWGDDVMGNLETQIDIEFGNVGMACPEIAFPLLSKGLSSMLSMSSLASDDYSALFPLPLPEELDEPSFHAVPVVSPSHSLSLGDQVPSDMSLIFNTHLDTSKVHESDFAPLCPERNDVPFLWLDADEMPLATGASIAESSSFMMEVNQDVTMLFDVGLDTSEVHEEDFAPIDITQGSVPFLQFPDALSLGQDQSCEGSSMADLSSFNMAGTADLSFLMDGSFAASEVHDDDFAPLDAHQAVVPSLRLPEAGDSDAPITDSSSFTMMVCADPSLLVDTSLDLSEIHYSDFDTSLQLVEAASPEHDQSADGCLMVGAPSFTIAVGADLSLLLDTSMDVSHVSADDFAPLDPSAQHDFAPRVTFSAASPRSKDVVVGHAALSASPSLVLDFSADLSALLEVSLSMSEGDDDDFSPLPREEDDLHCALNLSSSFVLDAVVDEFSMINELSLVSADEEEEDFAPLSPEEQRAAPFRFQDKTPPSEARRFDACALSPATNTSRHTLQAMESPSLYASSLSHSLSRTPGTPELSSSTSFSSASSFDSPCATPPHNLTNATEPLTSLDLCAGGDNDFAPLPFGTPSPFRRAIPQSGKFPLKQRASGISPLAMFALNNNLALRGF